PDQHRRRGDLEDVARAREHPREDVPAELVDAEQVAPRRPRELGERLVERIVRRNRAAEERADDPEAEDQRSHDERLRARELAERLAAGEPRLRSPGREGDGTHVPTYEPG